ncbi:MAG: SBBP repeat-containing protein [Thermodesulfobacteriota bacterium]
MRIPSALSFAAKILIPVLLILTLSDTFRLPVQETPENNRSLQAATLTSVQIPFIANQGQAGEDVSFYARTFNGNFFVTRDGEMVYEVGRGKREVGRGKSERGARNSELGTGNSLSTPPPFEKGDRGGFQPVVLKERLLNAKVIVPQGTDRAETKVNYYIGNDKAKWKADVPTFNAVFIGRVYDNIDLSLRAYGRKVEKVFTVHPGGRVGDIRLGFDGATSLKTNAAGELEVQIPPGPPLPKGGEDVRLALPNGGGRSGDPIGSEVGNETAPSPPLSKRGDRGDFVRFSAPIAFQEINGKRREVQVAYDVRGEKEYRFRVGEYDRMNALIIDPKLVFSTYLGGSSTDSGQRIALDGSGNIYVVGITQSADFPTRNAYQGSNQGDSDAFVTKLNSSGSSILYSTYLGGSGGDQGVTIAIDYSGNAYVAGYTSSNNFPTLNPYQGGLQGGDTDIFVTKLDSGGGLVYSTYIGGNGTEVAYANFVDSSGNVFITGYTTSANFPTVLPYQAANQGGTDAFVTKLNSTGDNLVYSTYLGGGGYDHGQGIAVDSSGNANITGYTDSNNFPTMAPYQASFQGGTYDAFVTKLTSAGGLAYSTYLGGSGLDKAECIALDNSLNIYVKGSTTSNNFPTLNPYQGGNAGGNDVFVTKFNPSGSALIYSTYFGGTGDDYGDYGKQLAVDSLGNAFISGRTNSTNLPTKNPIQGNSGGGWDAFVSRLAPSGKDLAFSTYLGGSGNDYAMGIAEHMGDVYIVGLASTNFPLQKPYQVTYGGGTSDAFVTKISPVTKAKMFYFSPVHNLKE